MSAFQMLRTFIIGSWISPVSAFQNFVVGAHSLIRICVWSGAHIAFGIIIIYNNPAYNAGDFEGHLRHDACELGAWPPRRAGDDP